MRGPFEIDTLCPLLLLFLLLLLFETRASFNIFLLIDCSEYTQTG